MENLQMEDKEVSRQRLWQLKMKKEKRCIICGKRELADKHCCEEHRVKKILANRKRKNLPLDAPIRKNDRNNFLSKHNPNYKENFKTHNRNRYRKKHGIPLDAPKNSMYNKRGECTAMVDVGMKDFTVLQINIISAKARLAFFNKLIKEFPDKTMYEIHDSLIVENVDQEDMNKITDILYKEKIAHLMTGFKKKE